MYLILISICLLFIGTEILANEKDPEDIIMKLNNVVSEMIKDDDIEKYRSLSKVALNITLNYFQHMEKFAVDETYSNKSEEIEHSVTNPTGEEDEDKNHTRRHTYAQEKDAKFCDTLFHNMDVALNLVELNLDEVKKHPNCVYGKSTRGQQFDFGMLKMALDDWQTSKGYIWPPLIDSGVSFSKIKPDFVFLVSALIPGFTPTPLQEHKLETILKRPVFLKLLKSNPDLCLVENLSPQGNTVSITSDNLGMPLDQELQSGKLEKAIKNPYYLSSQTPIGSSQKYLFGSDLNPNLSNSYSKYQKIPELFQSLQKPKESYWPLLLNAETIPNIENHKFLQKGPTVDYLTSKNPNSAPIITSIPISDQAYQFLIHPELKKQNYKKYLSPVQIPTSSGFINSRLPHLPVQYPNSKTPGELEKLKIILPKLGQKSVNLPLNLHATPYKINNAFGIPVPKKKNFNPFSHQNPKSLQFYPKDKMLPATPDLLYGPNDQDDTINPFYNVKKPNLIFQKQTEPIFPALSFDEQFPDYIVKKKDKDMSPLNEFDSPKNMKLPFESPFSKKTNFNTSHQRPRGLVYFPKDRIQHKFPTPDLLNGAIDGNREETIYPYNNNGDYNDHTFTKVPTKNPVVWDTIYNKPVNSKFETPFYPLAQDKVKYNEGADQDQKLPNINELNYIQKGPIQNDLPSILYNIQKLYPKHINPNKQDTYFPDSILSKNLQRPPKYMKKKHDRDEKNIASEYPYDLITNSMYNNKIDNTRPWPLGKLSDDLFHASPKIPFQNDKISDINLNLPKPNFLDQSENLGHLKHTNPKWNQFPTSPYSSGQIVGLPDLKKNYEPNAQYHQNPFKNSYQIDDWLSKTPHDLLQNDGESNWIKLATSRPSQTEVELIFLMKAQEPIIYWPIYYLAYKIPTKTLINKIKTTPINKPIKSSTNHILHELVNSHPYSAISPELKSLQARDLWRLLKKNGLVVAANIYKNNKKINDEDYLITMDKIINIPSNYEQIKSNYFRSGRKGSEEVEYINTDQNENPVAFNNLDDRGRRLLDLYPQISYNFVPSGISRPLLYKLQAQKKFMAAIANLKRLQKIQKSPLNYHVLNYDNIKNPYFQSIQQTEPKEKKSNSPLKIDSNNDGPQSKAQTINIHFGRNNDKDKAIVNIISEEEQISKTTESESESTEEYLRVKSLRAPETPIKVDIDVKNSTVKSDTFKTSTNETKITITQKENGFNNNDLIKLYGKTVKVPLDDVN